MFSAVDRMLTKSIRKEIILDKDIVARTQKTADLYFKDVKDERPFDLWRSFDKDLAKDLSLFITGQMYARCR